MCGPRSSATIVIRGETVPDDAPREDPEPPSDQVVIKGEIEP